MRSLRTALLATVYALALAAMAYEIARWSARHEVRRMSKHRRWTPTILEKGVKR